MRASLLRVYVHLVWSTWDRLPLLVEPVRTAVYRCIQKEARQMRCEVIAIGGVEDHVHVLVRMSSSTSISDLVKQVKGASSHLIQSQVSPDGFFRWQGGYGAFSVSPRYVPSVVEYIRNQEDRHRTRDLIAGVEPAPARSAQADIV